LCMQPGTCWRCTILLRATRFTGNTLATALVCALALPFVGLPPPVAWPWIGAASLCDLLYLRTLGKAYEHPGFCTVYGVVRAIVPSVMFLAGWLVLREPLRSAAFVLLLAYLFGMWAYAHGPVGLVAPIRESRLFCAGVFSVMVLRREVTRAQWTAILLATMGFALVQAG
jgi:hypothetical protein